MPQVSIGMPVYNGERYLAQAMDSLLAQTFGDFEIVISDNASNDRTAEICHLYQARDSRVRYFRNQRNIGAAANFNRTFHLSSAPLFQCAACDDVYEPFFLERCVAVLERESDVVLCHTSTTVIGDGGEPLQSTGKRGLFFDSYGDRVIGAERDHMGKSAEPELRFREILWWATWCLPLFGVMRRAALAKTGLHGNYFGGDKVLLADLALRGRFRELPDKLFCKRVHRGCTYYKSTAEKARHDSEESRGIPQLNMLRDYTRMVLAADLTPNQRLHCMITVLGMVRRHGLWRKLLVPGPDNYLGLSFGAK